MSEISHRSPGQLALSVMGWVELTISIIMLVLNVVPAAVAFAIAALFLTFLSTQVRKQQVEYLRRTGQAVAVAPRRPGVLFWVQLGLGAALIIASAVFAVLGNYAFAVNFVLWGLTLGLFAQRMAQPVEA